jgi:hypothetical protein
MTLVFIFFNSREIQVGLIHKTNLNGRAIMKSKTVSNGPDIFKVKLISLSFHVSYFILIVSLKIRTVENVSYLEWSSNTSKFLSLIKEVSTAFDSRETRNQKWQLHLFFPLS